MNQDKNMWKAYLTIGGVILAFIGFSILRQMEFKAPPHFPTITPTVKKQPTQKTIIATPTFDVVYDTSLNCYEWSQIDASMQGETECVYGELSDYVENWDAQQTFFYFGGRDEFFFTTTIMQWSVTENTCITATGKIELNSYQVPYMKIDNLTNCYGWMVGSPLKSPPLSQPTSNPVEVSGCPNGCAYPPVGCDIKGNISFDSQEKIYHVPGQEFYDATTINTDYGEVWFCTEAEARANGWRKANN